MNPSQPTAPLPLLLAWNPLYRWPWLWFLLAFATLLGAWTVFIILATKHPVALVPLNMPPPATAVHSR